MNKVREITVSKDSMEEALMRERFIIVIDGPSGSGKSTVAKNVACKLGFRYLDTGAIYRAVAFILDEWGVEPEEGLDLKNGLNNISVQLKESSVIVNGRDISDKIRNPHISAMASRFSALPSVRASLLNIQRAQADLGNMVAEGRDMGTVVFPKAQLKIFLVANEDVRAERRWLELKAKGMNVERSEILSKIRDRDSNDSSRALAPLVKADDAVLIDTSNLTIEDVVGRILYLVNERVRVDSC